MNTAWDLWIMSYGIIALTLVTLGMVMMHLDMHSEDNETKRLIGTTAKPKRPDKYENAKKS